MTAKQYLIVFILLNCVLSCKKEKQPPAELVGRWENRYIYVENYLVDTITKHFDTIPIYNRHWTEYDNSYNVKTDLYFPDCVGSYKLIRNKEFIEYYFPCQVLGGLSNGKILFKIHKLTSDTLILEDSFESGFSRTILIKIK
jgi:hypothetical protein